VIIKVLFVILVASVVALIGVAIAVFVRVWWQLKARRAQPGNSAEAVQESSKDGSP
jgi:ABC-type Fe3+ transport system permease subunit